MRVDELLNMYYDELSDNEKYVCHYLTGPVSYTHLTLPTKLEV